MKKILLSLFAILLNLTILLGPANAEVQQNTLSLQDAIRKSFVNSATIKNQTIEIEKNDIYFDSASNLLRYTPVDLSFDPGDANLFKTFYGAQLQKRLAEKKFDNDCRQLVIDAKKTYFSVHKAKTAVEAAEIAYQKAQVKQLQAKSKYDVGMLTKAELVSAETQVATELYNLLDTKSKLETAYIDLNKLIGSPLSDRYILMDQPVVEKFEFDVDAKVNAALGNSYEIWTAEEETKYRDQIKLFEKYYDVGDYNVYQAKNNEFDRKESIRKQVIDLCNGIQALYQLSEQMKATITQAEESLKVAEAQWKAGLITRDNVLLAQGALQNARTGQLEVAVSYNMAVDSLLRLTGELNYTAYKK